MINLPRTATRRGACITLSAGRDFSTIVHKQWHFVLRDPVLHLELPYRRCLCGGRRNLTENHCSYNLAGCSDGSRHHFLANSYQEPWLTRGLVRFADLD